MSVIIKTNAMKYKDSTGEYHGFNAIAQESTNQQINNINNIGEAQIAAIQQKGIDTLNSIPSNYGILQNEVNRLNNVITTEQATRETSDNELINKVDNIVIVSEEEPQEKVNKVWINSDAEEMQVPTYTEYSELKGAFTSKIDAIRDAYGKNIYNRETTKRHVLLNATTGEEEYSLPNDSSDFIPLDTAKVSMRNLNQQGISTLYRIYFYDSNKGFIERQYDTTADTMVFTAPPNTAYIRVVISTIESSQSKFVIAKGETTIVTFVPFYTAYDRTARDSLVSVNNSITSINESLSSVAGDVSNEVAAREAAILAEESVREAADNELEASTDSKLNSIRDTYGKNIYNWETTKEHVLLNASTGQEEYSAFSNSSDFIPLDTAKVSMRDLNQYGVDTLYRVYFYDSNKAFIRRDAPTTANTAVFECPDSTAYIRIVIPVGSLPLSKSKYVVAKGETVIVSYVPYYTAYDRVARESIVGVQNVMAARIVSPPPMLTIIDDDGHLDYSTYLLPFAKSLNAPISSAVTPLRFGGNSGEGRYMTLEEVKQCMVDGAEILCHTYTHVPINDDIKKYMVINGTYINQTSFVDTNGDAVVGNSYTVYHDVSTNKYYLYGSVYSEINNATIPSENKQKLIDVYTDVTGYFDQNNNPCYVNIEDYYTDKLAKYYEIAKNILMQNGFNDANILVYNNDTGDDPMAQNAARRIFRCGFDINGSQLNKFGEINRVQVHRYSIENAANGYYGVNRMKQLIDSALTNGGWMVWTMHTTGNEWRGTTSGSHTGIGKDEVLNRLEQAVNYAHSRGLQIVTASYGCSAYIDGVY